MAVGKLNHLVQSHFILKHIIMYVKPNHKKKQQNNNNKHNSFYIAFHYHYNRADCQTVGQQNS